MATNNAVKDLEALVNVTANTTERQTVFLGIPLSYAAIRMIEIDNGVVAVVPVSVINAVVEHCQNDVELRNNIVNACGGFFTFFTVRVDKDAIDNEKSRLTQKVTLNEEQRYARRPSNRRRTTNNKRIDDNDNDDGDMEHA